MTQSPSKSTTTPVGIDLGTTYSVIAYMDDDDQPKTIINSEGDLITPSVVLIEDHDVTIGKQALKAESSLPEHVARFAKRHIGRKSLPHPIDGNEVSPEWIEGLILKRLRRDAESRLGTKVEQAVITVPAYFNEPRRHSTIRAAKMAGLQVLAIINEPTAAAIAYGVKRHSQILGPQTVLVYDLGGGTFDASLVRVAESKVNVLATDGNAMLGGIDWDRCLASWLDDQFRSRCKMRPSEAENGQSWLMQEAADLKHALTSRSEVKVRLSFQGDNLATKISRDQFYELTAHLLDRTRFTLKKLLQEAKLKWDAIDQVLLVGGSTRMPQVATMVESLTGIEPNVAISADEAVAHGAAAFASELAAQAKQSARSAARLTVSDVNAHQLGVLGTDLETNLRCNRVMIPRNTSLPAQRTAQFKTIHPNQRSVVVEVLEGGDARGRYGTHIGRCVLRDLPAGLPAGSGIDVTFRYDRDGLIRIEAVLAKTGQKAGIEIERQNVHVASENIDELDADWSIDA